MEIIGYNFLNYNCFKVNLLDSVNLIEIVM